MGIADAKKLIGKTCNVSWLDRTGRELNIVSRIHDATYVPMYGTYLITDTDDVALEKVTAIDIVAEDGQVLAVFGRTTESMRVAA